MSADLSIFHKICGQKQEIQNSTSEPILKLNAYLFIPDKL